MDPRQLTLRHLWWMAGGRWESEFGVTSAVLAAAFAGKSAKVQNPYKPAPAPPPLPPEQRKAESDRAWRGFFGLFGKRGKKIEAARAAAKARAAEIKAAADWSI